MHAKPVLRVQIEVEINRPGSVITAVIPLNQTTAMTEWKMIGVAAEGSPVRIGSFANVWDHTWESTGQKPVELQHPSYQTQFHTFTIYQITNDNLTQMFAAGELSMNVWGFYEPK